MSHEALRYTLTPHDMAYFTQTLLFCRSPLEWERTFMLPLLHWYLAAR